MLKRKPSYAALAVVTTAAVILIAGGVAIASNAGFKLNMPIYLDQGVANNVGDNWLSIPYFNPYGTVNGFCTQVGLASTGGPLVPKGSMSRVNAQNGVGSTFQCGSAAGAAEPLGAPRGWLVRQPSAAGGPASIIIVGSHDPTLQMTLIQSTAGVTNSGDNWFSVPYHTTSVTMADFCASHGLSSTGGALVPKAQISRVNAQNGTGVTGSCGTASASNPLVLGEAIRIREPNAPKTFIPAHY